MYVGKKGFISRYTVYLCQYFVFYFSKIIVDGVRGISYRGDAALDDFSFQKGTCNQTGIYRTAKKLQLQLPFNLYLSDKFLFSQSRLWIPL